MLGDITIQGYRCLEDFHIDGLARVNLIVGANNSGKTSLLEAVYLLAVAEGRIFELLYNRGEIMERTSTHRIGEVSNRSLGYLINHIFHGHKPQHSIRLHSSREQALFLEIQLNPDLNEVNYKASVLKLHLEGQGTEREANYPVLDDDTIERPASLATRPHQLHHFLTTRHLNIIQLARLWDKITLTIKEEKVIAALRILEPDVERISFTSRQTTHSGILVKLRGQPKPIPIGSMGDGMHRVLALSMSVVMAEDGILLVDEIDTGLYYKTQTDVWRLLIKTAQQLNVQIFATTHSWDCVHAFHESLTKAEDPIVGKLFRMSMRDEKIRSVPYTANELAIAVQQNIEVR